MNAVMLLTGLRGRFTPVPTAWHICFCIFATIVFAAIFLRKKTVSSLIWLLICDTPIVLQFFGDKSTAAAVAICEIFLFALLFWTTSNERIAKKKQQLREEEEQKHPDAFFPEDMGDIDRLIKSESSNLADNKDDVIHNAFEDDRR